MSIKEAYNQWASQYDSQANKTRDLEAYALRSLLADYKFKAILEVGCGTGKNTSWLYHQTQHLTAVDFSENMLEQARQKVEAEHVEFRQADIQQTWEFADRPYDLITFSLVLEHINDLHAIFRKASKVLLPGGYIYVGELHPFKQYTGTKANFEQNNTKTELECFVHHTSDYIQAALNNGLALKGFEEFFDKEDGKPPRILALLFQKDKKKKKGSGYIARL